MQADMFKCPCCSKPYDLQLHIPKVLTSCANHICLECLQMVFLDNSPEELICPTCNQRFSETFPNPDAFPTHVTIVELIRSRSRKTIEECETHGSKKDLFCLEDQATICKYCMKDKEHKGHEIQPVKVLMDNAGKKRNKLKQRIEDGKMKKREVEEEMKEKFAEAQKIIQDQFLEMRVRLHLKEEEIMKNIERSWKEGEERIGSEFEKKEKMWEAQIAEIPEKSFELKLSKDVDDEPDDNGIVNEVKKQLEGLFKEAEGLFAIFFKKVEKGNMKTNEISTQTSDIMEESLQVANEIQMLAGEAFIDEEQPPEVKEEYIEYGMMEVLEKVEECDHQSGISVKCEVDYNDRKEIDEEENKVIVHLKENENIEKQIQDIKDQIMDLKMNTKIKFVLKNITEDFDKLCLAGFWNEHVWKTSSRVYHVEADFSGSSITDDQLSMFYKYILTNMKSASFININLAETKVSDESIETLSYRVLRGRSLHTLKLSFSNTAIGDSSLKFLKDGMESSLKTLENLELVFDSATAIVGNVKEFYGAFSEMTQLKNLHLSFEKSKMSSEGICLLFSILFEIVTRLETLDLNFNNTKLSDANVGKFSNNIISQMKKLKNFRFCIGGNPNLSNRIMTKFFQSLKPIACQFISFELDLHSTGIHNPVFAYFMKEVLGEMMNLEGLRINLSKTKITHEGLKHMNIAAINLKSLAINFNETNINDHSLEVVKKKGVLPSVRKLEIQLEKTFVSNQALKELFDYIGKHGNRLECLHLNLAHTYVENRSILCLKEKVLPLMNWLEDLQINLHCTLVSSQNKDFQHFGKSAVKILVE